MRERAVDALAAVEDAHELVARRPVSGDLDELLLSKRPRRQGLELGRDGKVVDCQEAQSLHPSVHRLILLRLDGLGREHAVVQLCHHKLLDAVARALELGGIAARPQRVIGNVRLRLLEKGLHGLSELVDGEAAISTLRGRKRVAHKELHRTEQRGGLRVIELCKKGLVG